MSHEMLLDAYLIKLAFLTSVWNSTFFRCIRVDWETSLSKSAA